MRGRTRDIALLVTAVAVLLAAVVGGYAAVRARAAGSGAQQALAPVVMPSASGAASASPAPQFRRWTVGVARRPLTVYRRADTGSPVVARLSMRTAADYPTIVLVDTISSKGALVWYRIWAPVKPNGTQGWVREGDLAFYTTASRIVIDLSRRTLSVYIKDQLVRSFRVAVGQPSLPTPTGHFYITEKLRPPYPNGPYGVLALGTSAFQPRLSDWPGGGQVAIHGTNEPWLIGKAVSHGCVRMTNAAVKQVSSLVPTGSPVDIVK